jgi:serine/threonine protein kinase/Flp pilus assembly protein TadD
MGKQNNTILCLQCNTPIPEDSTYCSKCGFLLKKKADTLTYTPPIDHLIDDSLQFSPGDQFGTRYIVVEEIGRGGMGRVYKAKDKELDITVALKMIHPKYSTNLRFIQQLKEETLMARTVSHENVIRIHDIGEVDGIKFISMDYIKGHDLRDLIHTSRTLSVETAISITRQICEGLEGAHQKHIVHLDLKPSNIMIDTEGKVFIMDFGVARSQEAHEIGPEKKVIGTPPYISPEQAKAEKVDQRSDIYSLGIIIYEMLTGKRPFEADTVDSYIQKHLTENPRPPRELNPRIPQALENIILKCLAKKRENRYQDCKEIIKDLYVCQNVIKSPVQKYWKTLLKRPAFYIILVLILAIPIYYIFIQNGKDISTGPGLARMNIVVLPFENYSGNPDLDRYKDSVQNSIILAVGQSKYIYPLPAVRLRSILKKINHPEEEPFTKTVLDKIAKEENTQFFIEGEYSRLNENIRFTVRITEPPGYETITHKIIYFSEKKDESERIDELTSWIKTELGFTRYEIYDPENISIKNLTGSYRALELYFQAQRAFFESKYEESNQKLAEAVKLDPNFAMAYRRMATNYSYIGNAALKKEKLLIARKLANEGYGTKREQNLIKGYAAYILDNSAEQAIACYDEVLKSYPEDVETHAMLGSVYRNMEEWSLAENHFRQALEFTPDLIHENLAWIYMHQGRYPEAINLINGNKEIITPLFVHKILAMIYLCQGNIKAAVNQAEILKSAFHGYQMTAEIIGNIYQIQGDYAEARKYYTSLTQNPSLDFQGYEWLPLLMMQEGRFNDCEQELKQQIDMSRRKKNEDDEITFLQLFAYAYLQCHRPNLALQICENILQKTNLTSEESVFCRLIKGLSFLKLSDNETAEQEVHEIEKIFATLEDTSYLKGYQRYLEGMIHLEKGDFETAIDRLIEANSFLTCQSSNYDQHAFYYDALARAYYRSGDFVNAENYFEKIQQLTTGRLRWGDLYVKSFYWLGKIAHLQGRIQEAKKNFTAFLRLWEKADSGLREIKDAKSLLKTIM